MLNIHRPESLLNSIRIDFADHRMVRNEGAQKPLGQNLLADMSRFSVAQRPRGRNTLETCGTALCRCRIAQHADRWVVNLPTSSPRTYSSTWKVLIRLSSSTK